MMPLGQGSAVLVTTPMSWLIFTALGGFLNRILVFDDEFLIWCSNCHMTESKDAKDTPSPG